MKNFIEIIKTSAKLGLTSFGGPVAHLGYFHEEYVVRKKWIDDKSYSDIVALCQFLPGPASSQVGIAIGMIRGGFLGGFASWLGFTLPSVIALILFSTLIQGFDITNAGWIHSLKLVAIAVVAQAILGMGKSLAPDRTRATIAILSAVFSLLFASTFTQVTIILLAGLIGMFIFNKVKQNDAPNMNLTISRRTALISISIFFGLLLLLPIVRYFNSSQIIAVFDSFYRAGSLVYGGGHVVLPLLEREVVPNGWVSSDLFIAGYGAAQAVPGPLFTFASYLGAAMGGWTWGLFTTFAIFLPSFLLVTGVLPFWNSLRRKPKIQSALMGVNAAVIGILIATLYNPLWTSTIHSIIDLCFALIAFCMLYYWKIPSWIVVIVSLIAGIILF